MESVERKFKTKIVQITDDFDQQDDDPKIASLREMAFIAFKTYCNTVLGEETAGQSRLDLTGQPDEFASGTNKMSRLEQLM